MTMEDSPRQSFLAELKRRKVVRVAAVYAATAFVVLQGADLVLPALLLPEWTYRMLVLLTLFGFPVAVALGWVLELTPDGVRVTTSAASAAGETPPSLLGRRTLAVTGTLLVLGVGLGAGLFLAPAAEQPAGTPATGVIDDKSVAVLPFADLSEAGDQKWFAEGIAEEILTALARLPELRVVGRNSSFLFAGGAWDDRVIADTLGVAHLVKGSVRRIGDRLRVNAQLVRAHDGVQLWSESYDRAAADLLDVQRDVAEKVVAALDVFLDDERRARMFASGTRSVAAFEAYLRGRQLFDQAHLPGNSLNLGDANRWLDSALVLDPGFGRAALFRADRYMHHVMAGPRESDLGDMPITTALAELRRSLDIAVQNAPDEYSRLMTELEREFFAPTWHRVPELARQLRALGGLENEDVGSVWAPNFLGVTGHVDLARAVTAHSLELERLRPPPWTRSIHVRMVAGELDSARHLIDQARAHVGDHPALRRAAVFTALLQGDREGLRAEAAGSMAWAADALRGDTAALLRRAAASDPDNPWPDTELLHLYHHAGEAEKLRQLVRRIDALPSGPAIFVVHLFRSAAAPTFDLADAPNFSARLREAGVDPAAMRRMPRISELPR